MHFNDEAVIGFFESGWSGETPLVFERVEVLGCSLRGDVSDPAALVVSNVEIHDCVVRGGGVSGVHLREVLVNGLRTASLPALHANVYEHVTLRGRVQQLTVNDAPISLNAEQQSFTAKAYDSIDWALDIRELQAREITIRGVPSRLIRHDPQIHAVVNRQAAVAGTWRDLDLTGSRISIMLSQLAKSCWEDIVLIPAAWGKYSEPDKLAINRLRAAGIAS